MHHIDNRSYQVEKNCPLCARDFPNAYEENLFQQRLMGLLEKIPAVQINARKDLEDATVTRNRLLPLVPKFDECERLKNLEIPELRRLMSSLEKERYELMNRSEDVFLRFTYTDSSVPPWPLKRSS